MNASLQYTLWHPHTLTQQCPMTKLCFASLVVHVAHLMKMQVQHKLNLQLKNVNTLLWIFSDFKVPHHPLSLDNKQHDFRSNKPLLLVNLLLTSVSKLLLGSCFELSPQGVVLISQALILTFLEESCCAYFLPSPRNPTGEGERNTAK